MAYQTSCASYTSGRVGLSSATAVVADAAGREQAQHGSPLFPIACYAEDLSCFSVAWHWHEEFEFILAALGPIHVDVNKTRLTLQTGQGVFINSGALHAVEPAEGRALLHSGVFQPRLVGGMDTVFWQKLIRPLLQPGTPPFFLLDEAVPWQRQVLLCLREAWKGGRAFRLREPGALPPYCRPAAAHYPMRQRQSKGIGAGADCLGADEADAALCRGALR